MRNKEIAYKLGITEGTVKVYLYKLFRKLGTNDRLGLALCGLRNLFSGAPDAARERFDESGSPRPDRIPVSFFVDQEQSAGTLLH